MMQLVDGASVHTHTFNRAAERTMEQANKISYGRGEEYADSWSLTNLHTPWLDNLLQAWPTAPDSLVKEHKRLIIMASMLDIKLSRLGGGWKTDTAIDSINYTAAYCSLRNEFEDMTRSIKKARSALPNDFPVEGISNNSGPSPSNGQYAFKGLR